MKILIEADDVRAMIMIGDEMADTLKVLGRPRLAMTWKRISHFETWQQTVTEIKLFPDEVKLKDNESSDA